MSSMHRDDDPVLITEAEPSLGDQLKSRQRKYMLMMSTRLLWLRSPARPLAPNTEITPVV